MINGIKSLWRSISTRRHLGQRRSRHVSRGRGKMSQEDLQWSHNTATAAMKTLDRPTQHFTPDSPFLLPGGWNTWAPQRRRAYETTAGAPQHTQKSTPHITGSLEGETRWRPWLVGLAESTEGQRKQQNMPWHHVQGCMTNTSRTGPPGGLSTDHKPAPDIFPSLETRSRGDDDDDDDGRRRYVRQKQQV